MKEVSWSDKRISSEYLRLDTSPCLYFVFTKKKYLISCPALKTENCVSAGWPDLALNWFLCDSQSERRYRNAGGFSKQPLGTASVLTLCNCNDEACCLRGKISGRLSRLPSPVCRTGRIFLTNTRTQRDPAARYHFIFLFSFVSLIMRWQMHVMVGWESDSVKAVLEGWETGGGGRRRKLPGGVSRCFVHNHHIVSYLS